MAASLPAATDHVDSMRVVVHVLGLGPPNDPNCGEACTVRNIRLENFVVRDGSWNGIYASGGYYQFNGLAGRNYRIETSADFKLWNKPGTATEKSPGRFELTDRSDTALRVYRAVVRGVPGD